MLALKVACAAPPNEPKGKIFELYQFVNRFMMGYQTHMQKWVEIIYNFTFNLQYLFIDSVYVQWARQCQKYNNPTKFNIKLIVLDISFLHWCLVCVKFKGGELVSGLTLPTLG